MLMDMLVLLAEHAGEVVSKDEIVRRVRDNRLVSESALSRDMAALRRLLGDDTRHPRYIETIPKRGFRLVARVAAVEPRGTPRVAVLPFQSFGREVGDDYLADGLADALTTELARIPELFVISRQSMLRFRATSRTIPEIARELNADAIVEGSVLRTSGRIRVTAQLVDARSDKHLWAESSEGDEAGAMAILGTMTHAFAESIRSALTGCTAPRRKPPPDVDAEARLEYLKGRYYFATWSREGLRKAISHFQRALEIDPTYASAYEGLAWSLAVLGYWGFMPIHEAYPKAKAAALHALLLDPSLSEAHTSLALVKWLHDWDLAGFRTEIATALELNPNSPFAHLLHGLFLATIERDRGRTVAELKTLLELDPLSPVSNFSAAFVLVFAGAYEEAAERARRTLTLYPDVPLAMYALGWAEVGLRQDAEALAVFEQAANRSPDPIALSYVAFAAGRAGRKEAASALLERLTGEAKEPLPDFACALIHIGLSDFDRAFECLERSLADRDSRIFWFAVLPGLERLREDPRFADLSRRIMLACAAPATSVSEGSSA
jgi:TolB-like protein/Tfp pilus assembly protein PilF